MKLLSWKTAALVSAGLLVGRRLTRPRYDFRGKTVLITGGGRGLGLELARVFAAEGARLVLCARDGSELERAKALLAPAEVHTNVCDVTLQADVDALIKQVNAEVGAVDVLVNVAGVIGVGPAALMGFEDFDQSMQTHFYGPLRLILGLRDQLRARRGRIINIASVGGKVPAPHLLPYDAGKFALVGLSEGLHVEMLKEGVVVTTVCPGLMRTGSPGRARVKGRVESEISWFTVADSLPYLSIAADTAARQIVEACRVGQAELIITGRAKLLSRLHGLAPNLSLHLLTLADAFLPSAEGGSTLSVEGRTVQTAWTRSFLTLLTRRAARRNLEV